MKKLYSTIDKAIVSTMPTVIFEGRVHEISDMSAMSEALCELSHQMVIGIDTETRPSFTKGKTNKVSLLQLATHDTCYLIHLNCTGLTDGLIKLLENGDILKVGLSLNDDIRALKQRTVFEPAGFVDLQSLFPQLGITDMSLQKLFANLFHKRISKREQLSNWSRVPLTEKQRRYAATDAWACLKLYDEYVRLSISGDYVIRAEIEEEKTEM